MLADTKRFAEHIAASGASIIHVHNTPDALMRFADRGAEGRPVVYDCHDLEYHQHGEVTPDELFAFWRADAIVSVGRAYRDLAYSLHAWQVPDAVVRSLPVREHIPRYDGDRSGIVYEGGLAEPGRCGWRDLSVPCREFADAGLLFDIYTLPRMAEHYPHVRGYLPYRALMQALSTYSYGFVGSDPRHTALVWALPNKVWEYAACGVIPLLVNADASAEEFGTGIVASSTREAISIMREADEDALRADVCRHARYMNEEIERLEGLYREVL